MNQTTKKVCLLTGAGGQLGNAFCRFYADKYHIVGVYRSKPPNVPSQQQLFVDPLNPKTKVLENEHPVFAIKADLSDDRQLERIVELTLARFDRIDLLVNAAVNLILAPIIEDNRQLENIEAQFNINVIVPLKLAVMVARNFWRNRVEENTQMNRNVINVSSISGVNIYPGIGQSIYSASKAGLNHLTRHMAYEFQSFGVRVNATAPTSFPSIISTESVVQSIIRLDEGTMTGKVLILDQEGENLT
ncbi:MAG: SDR family oxidoreductase [Nostoc sp.]